MGSSASFAPLVLAIVGLAVVVMAVGLVAAKRRRDTLLAEVSQRGWRYRADAQGWYDAFTVAPFGSGDRQESSDLIEGAIGQDSFVTFTLTVEDDTVDADGTRSRSSDHYQVVCVPVPAVVPRLVCTPDNAILRSLTAFGLRDLEVESHEFNQRWRVVADDEAYAHAVLAPTVIDAFLAAERQMGMIFLENGYLVAVSTRLHADLGWVDSFVQSMTRIRDAIPAFVFSQYGQAKP